jgi:hypothetical protein
MVKRPPPRDELDEVEASLQENATAIGGVEENIRGVEGEIERVGRTLSALNDDAVFAEVWDALSDRAKKRFGNEDAYYEALCADKPGLDKKEEDLRKEKEQLRKKEEDLRKKEEDLRAEKLRIEAARSDDKRLSGKFGRIVLKPLSEFEGAFDTRSSPYQARRWDLDFVKVPEYESVVGLVDDVLAKYVRDPAEDTMFQYPVVDGASGSGKSRLCWEVGMHFVRESDAQIVFVDCGTVPFEFGDETSIEHCEQCLAEVLFKRFVPKDAHRRFNYTLL